MISEEYSYEGEVIKGTLIPNGKGRKIKRDIESITLYEGWFVGGQEWGNGRLIVADQDQVMWSEGEFVLARCYGKPL